jgi:hypothetical protein
MCFWPLLFSDVGSAGDADSADCRFASNPPCDLPRLLVGYGAHRRDEICQRFSWQRA